jgi:hypothetical protein
LYALHIDDYYFGGLMAATWKDAESVFYWINAIGRELNVPFPKNVEERKEMQRTLYPKIIAAAVHSDFESEMEDFLDHGAFGDIRFRFEDYYGFKKEVRRLFIHWMLQNHTLCMYPQKSYFIMSRSMDTVHITEQNGRIVFSMQDDNDKYPVVVRLSKKQLFLLKPFLEANEIDIALLGGPLHELEQALVGRSYFILKYMNSFDSTKNKITYWTYSMISDDPKNLKEYFFKSIKGNFLPSFHPDDLPVPNIPSRYGFSSLSIKKDHIRTNGMGHLITHSKKGNVAISIKGELVGFVQKGRFDWLCTPRPELIPFINSLFSNRKRAS